MDLFLGGQALLKWSKHVKIWIPAWWFQLFMMAPTGTTYSTFFLGRLHPKMNRSGPSRRFQKRNKPASAIFWHSFSRVFAAWSCAMLAIRSPQKPTHRCLVKRRVLTYIMGKYRDLSVLIGKVMTKQWILGYFGC